MAGDDVDSHRWDILVIGAGPAGSYTAYRMAQSGLRVCLLEEHSTIGKPRHCTGVLGREAFDRFPDLPRDSIQAKLSSAWIVSPSGYRLKTSWFDGQAYVIQRTQFDQALADMAVHAGARLETGTVAESLESGPAGVRVRVSSNGRADTYFAQMAVIASGVSYRLHPMIGLEPPTHHLYCAQMEVRSDTLKDVEVFIGRDVAPGSFAWAVPLGDGHVRLGVTAHRRASQQLETLLNNPLLQDRVHRNGDSIVKRSVPIRPISCSVAKRVLLVGDAAGQVKPTTGGGIYYGLLGASLAAETLQKAFSEGRFDRSFLMAYDHAWRSELRKEMWLGRCCRAIFERLSDRRLDRLVQLCGQQRISEAVGEGANFDWHARSVLSLLSSPRVLSQLL